MEDPATTNPAADAAPASRRRTHWTDVWLGPWKGPYQLAWLAVLALAFANVWFGPLNQDEGWYLLAAQNVSRGMMPYRDFLYTQGPALPYAYGCLADVWSDAGVLGGRLFTALLGYLAAFFFALSAGELARRRDPDAFGPAFFLAFVLLGLSPDWAYFTAIPKTYALGSFFLALAFGLSLGLSRGAPGVPNRRGAAIAGACFALAAATRATLCLAAVPVWIALIAVARRDRAHRSDWLWFAVGCAAALALVYAPFLASCPDNFLFSQTYHAARASAPFGEWLVLRAGFVCFLAQGYPALAAAAAILAAATAGLKSQVESPKGRNAERETKDGKATCDLRPATCDLLYWSIVASFALLTLAHFLVPFPYADYNTPAMPLAAVALAVPLGRLVARANLRPWRVGLAALAASLAFVAASPWPMKWVDGEQHLFWFHSSLDSALARLRRAGRVVREKNPAGKPIFAQDAYLAVEAGVPVVPGFEMGPFSIFPDLSDDEARAHRVHNLATAERAIREADYDVAAISGYTFLLGCPSTEPLPDADRVRLRDALLGRFGAGRPVYRDDRFGQQNTELLLLSRNEPDPGLLRIEEAGSGDAGPEKSD